jgi:hypothetical protein
LPPRIPEIHRVVESFLGNSIGEILLLGMVDASKHNEIAEHLAASSNPSRTPAIREKFHLSPQKQDELPATERRSFTEP